MEIEEGLLGKAKDLIELVGKVIVGLIALFYVTGLLMVNVYYNRFGVYSLSLFRLNYIISGLWVFLPILVLFLSIAGYFFLFKSLFKHDKAKRAVKTLLFGSLLSSAVPAFAFTFVTSFGINLPTSSWIELGVSSGFVLATVAILLYSIRQANDLILAVTIVLCTFYLSHTFVFAQVYGAIPAHFGGGGTKDVQLLISADESDKKFFELSGLRFYENSNWTRTAQLLFATEDEYFLVVKPPEWTESSTLSVKRDLIKSILYRGLKGGGSGTSWDEQLSPTTTPQTSPSVPDISTSPSPP